MSDRESENVPEDPAEALGRSPKLNRLASVSDALNCLNDEQAILGATCRAAVDVLDAWHCGLVEFERGYRSGTVIAEYPPSVKAIGTHIPVEGIPAEVKLIWGREVLRYPDVNAEECKRDFAEFHSNLLRLNIGAILIVPIVREDRVIGSFSIDWDTPKQFSPDEIATCKLLASIVAGALSKARLLDPLVAATDLVQTGETFPAKIVEVLKLLVNANDAAFYIHYPRDRKLVRRGAAAPGWRPAYDLISESTTVPARMVNSRLPEFLGVESGDGCETPAPDGGSYWTLMATKMRVAGVLAVRRDSPLLDSHRLELQMFARYAVGSLLTAEQTFRDEIFHGLSAIAESDGDLVRALGAAAERIVNRFAITVCRVVLWDRSGRLRADVCAREAAAENPSAASQAQPATYKALQSKDDNTEWECSGSESHSHAFLHDWLTEEELASGIRVRFIPLRQAADLCGWLAVGGLSVGGTNWLDLDNQAARSVRDQILNLAARLRWRELDLHRTLLRTEYTDVYRCLEAAEGKPLTALDIVRLGTDLSGATAGMMMDWNASDGLCPSDVRYPRSTGEAIESSTQAIRGLRLPEQLRSDLRSGQCVWLSERDDSRLSAKSIWHAGFTAAAFCPLAEGRTLCGRVLLVLFKDGPASVPEVCLPLLDLFAASASATVAKILPHPPIDGTRCAELLQDVTRYCLGERDTTRAARAALTAITASYGLQYNRAVLLRVLRRDLGMSLRFEQALGASTRAIAARQWSKYNVSPHKSLGVFLTALRQGLPNDDELQLRLSDLTDIGDEQWSEALARIVESGKADKVSASDLPVALQSLLQADSDILVQPLVADSQIAGVVMVDNKYSLRTLDHNRECLGSLATVLAHTLLRTGPEDVPSGVEQAGAISFEPRLQAALRRLREPAADAVEIEARSLFHADASLMWEADRFVGSVGKSAVEAFLSNGYANSDREDTGPGSHEFRGYKSWQAVRNSGDRGRGSVLILLFRGRRSFSPLEAGRLVAFSRQAYQLASFELLLNDIANDQWRQGARFDDQLNRIAEHIRGASGCDAITLFSYSSQRHLFYHRPGLANVLAPDMAIGPGLVLPRSFLHDLVCISEPTFVVDVADSPYKGAPFVERERIRSVAVFPLLREREIIGLLFFNYRTGQPFDELERDGLVAVARHAASALSLAQQLEDRKRKQARIEATAALSQKLLACDDVPSAYRAILETAVSELDARCANMVIAEADGRLKLEAEIGWDPLFEAGQYYTSAQAHHARAVITRRTVIPVEDFELPQSFVVADAIRERRILSGLGVPIRLGDGRILGAMLIHSVERRCFDESEIQFLFQLAAQAGMVKLRADLGSEKRSDEATRAARTVQQSLDEVRQLIATARARQLDPPAEHCLAVACGALSDANRVLEAVVLQTREPASPAESSVRAGLVLERVWESYQALAVHRHLRIEWPAGNAISCRAAIDAANLELLIENMIGEALASAQPETVVRPVARRRNGNIEIEVCYSPETARPDGVEIGTCRAIAKRFNGQFHKGENELRVELPESVA